jgi:signal transduction histidine kinase
MLANMLGINEIRGSRAPKGQGLRRGVWAVALLLMLGGPAWAGGPPKPTAILDSLRRRLAAQPADTGRAQTLCELGYALAQLGRHAEARALLRQAYRISARLDFATGQVRSLSSLGVSYHNEGNFPQARVLLDSAVALGQRLHEQRKLGGTLLNRARLCNAQDDYACALASVLEAKRFFEAKHDWSSTANSLNGLGIIYTNHGDYPRALGVLFEAVQLARRHHDAQTEVNALGSIGNVYLKQNEYRQALGAYQQLLPRLDSVADPRSKPVAYQDVAMTMTHLHHPEAEAYFLKSLAGFEALNATADVGQALGSYAEFLREAGRLPEAIRAYTRALGLLRAADDQSSVANTLNGLARVFKQNGEAAKAVAPAREALAVAQRIHDLPEQQAAASLLAGLAKAAGDYRQALAYTEQAQAANDSLFSKAKSEEIGRLQGDYQLSQEREHAQALARLGEAQQHRLQAQQRQLWGLGLGLGVVALAGLALWRLNRLLGRKNQQIELQRAELTALNATKDQLFSIIGHDLRGPLHSLHAFVELLAGPPLPPEKLGQYTQRLTRTLDHTLALLENLLHWAALQMRATGPARPETLSLAALVEENIGLLAAAAEAAQVLVSHSLTGEEQAWADPAAVRLALRNLLANAIKFTPAGGAVQVSAHRADGAWQLAVADTGRGLPEPTQEQPLRPESLPRRAGEAGQARSTGLGLLLSRDLLARSGGQLWVASDGPGQGTTFTLRLPVAETVAAPAAVSA